MKDGGMIVIQTLGLSDFFDLDSKTLVMSKVRGRDLVLFVEQKGKQSSTSCSLKTPAIAGNVLTTKLMGSCSSKGPSHPMCVIQ